jgi:hypothetical protein
LFVQIKRHLTCREKKLKPFLETLMEQQARRGEILEQFQEVTGNFDLDECLKILERNKWDLQVCNIASLQSLKEQVGSKQYCWERREYSP